MASLFERAKVWLLKSRVLTSFVLVGIILIPIILLTRPYSKEVWNSILIEAHGLLFDLFVFGVILVIYDEVRSNALERRNYRNEIDDFRGWDASEAAYRNAGNVQNCGEIRHRNSFS